MISIITLNEQEKWDSIVKSFIDYDIYYLAGYVKAFRVHGDGEPILLFYNECGTRAINVVMRRAIFNEEKISSFLLNETFYDLSTPYGYGGFIIEGNDVESLLNEYSQFCRDNHIICEFVRFHPLLNNISLLETYYSITLCGKTITMNLKTKEIIWDNLTSKNRNMVRKAQKAGVRIEHGFNHELFCKFIKMYNSTMDKDNANKYYYFKEDFYDCIRNELKSNAIIFYALFNDEIIAMTIVLFANHRMHYHLSASNNEYKNLASTNLLLFEVACWGSENGYNYFHLGGGLGCNEDSLYRFKAAFNKKSDTFFSIGKKCFNSNIYDYLVKCRYNDDKSFNLNSNYFPLYRI